MTSKPDPRARNVCALEQVLVFGLPRPQAHLVARWMSAITRTAEEIPPRDLPSDVVTVHPVASVCA